MSKTLRPLKYWVMGLVVAVIVPHVVGTVYTNIIVTFMLDAVFALTVNLLMGYTGLVTFGHAMFLGLGGYAAALALKHMPGFPLIGVIFVSGLAAFLLSCAVAPLLARVTGTAFAMLTFGFGQLMYVICLKFREITGGEDGIAGYSTPPIHLGFTNVNITDPINFYYFSLIVLGAVTFLMWWLVNTPFGTVIVGIRDNALRVHYLGYRVKHSKALVLIISGTLAGFVGGIYALFHHLVSTDGVLTIFVSFYPLMACYIGGIGSFFGPILGAGILQGINVLISRYTQRIDLVNGIIFILVVMYLPMGSIGIWLSIKGWVLKNKRKA